MNDKAMLVSKSETIGVQEIRSLLEVTNQLSKVITREELNAIMTIYNSAINRLLAENGVEE